MVDAETVAVLDRINDLQEDVLDEVVAAEVTRLFGDLAEEITVGTVGEDDVDAGRGLDYVMQGDYVRMGGSESVKCDLPSLEGALPAVEAGLVEALDGVLFPISGNGLVYDAIGSEADDGDELEVAVVDPLAGKVRLLGVVGHLDSWSGARRSSSQCQKGRRRCRTGNRSRNRRSKEGELKEVLILETDGG